MNPDPGPRQHRTTRRGASRGPWPARGTYRYGRTSTQVTVLAVGHDSILIADPDGQLRFVGPERVTVDLDGAAA